ncbi:MAG: indolepyruvate ferredoxin oxidoreductase family protein [Alphaproteobacteria bacterium]|nr:indolepyruvate ferredoxin oxidoreductase family protein [Alphaproteobacteria bacterium]
MQLAAVTLDDKYALEKGRVYLTGTQALVRLPLVQRQLDARNGLNTAGFISGYRGSPLAGYDQALWRARRFLKENHVHFEPGVNEDLAATAVWGTQQLALYQGSRYDGVFALWYGKGPGVDRSGDVFKHGNMAGTARHGGVLLIAGDDHAGVSSTVPHQSDHAFMAHMIPVLSPANVQEYLDFGLLGIAMSRYSGCWIAFKAVTETVESSASIHVDPDSFHPVLPTDFQMPPEGLSIRWPDNWVDQEWRLMKLKLYAALAFARANRIDRVVWDSPKPRFGIITSGKAYLDTRQALEDLGIDEKLAAEVGIRLYKVGMPWPLEREGARHFAEGLEEVLVIEEKRALIENQLKEQLYNWREDVRPRVVGKFDEMANWILPSAGELTPALIARVIAARLSRFYSSPQIEERVAFIEAKEAAAKAEPPKIVRTPYFCSGCPHNTSTKVPEGSRAVAGIGCHFMVTWMNRKTETFTQMGGEGVPWIGQQPFTDEKHVFANLGDGTYYHSGLLAIRASVAAKVNITYKILFNDAVAMTGGQPVDGPISVPQITHQVFGEGVRRIAVVTDEPDKYPLGTNFAEGVTIHHRDELEAIQREMRDTPGCTVIIYDQTCAAEKRRRRKRGLYPDPPKRVFINDAVCEGCGDCSVKSNCLSVEPLETELGRKRQINQSSCNKDFSCLNGFCPSFVTVHGGALRKAAGGKAGAKAADPFAALPRPEPAPLTEPHSILVTGVGGTGVVTIGALLGMAAHLEGKGVSVLDMTGLAQKGGAVLSHVRIARQPEELHAVRIVTGGADLMIGCDMVVAGSTQALTRLASGKSHAIVNSHLIPTADFTQNANADFHEQSLKRAIRQAAGDNLTDFIAASEIATALMGDAIATNLFMLGYAIQRGLVPLSLESIEKAIELNGVAVETNRRTLNWGRLYAHDRRAVEERVRPVQPEALEPKPFARTLDEIVAIRATHLAAYQDAAYARRYQDLVRHVASVEREKAKGRTGLAETVARYAHKLMAYKDEYEVARLYSDGEFLAKLNRQFEGDYRLEFHLAPPLIAERDPVTGHLKKRAFGPWMLRAFALLAKFKRLRGTRLDIFGRTEERRMERRLIEEYFALVGEICDRLSPDNHALALELAGLPEQIRGFGHVKEASLARVKAREADLLARLRQPSGMVSAAE